MKTQMKWKFWQKKYEKLRGTACSIKSSTPIICRIFWKYFHDFNLIQLSYWITWKIQRYFSWEFEKIAWHSLNFQSNLWSITKQTESWTEHKNSSISQKSTENYTILFRLNKKRSQSIRISQFWTEFSSFKQVVKVRWKSPAASALAAESAEEKVAIAVLISCDQNRRIFQLIFINNVINTSLLINHVNLPHLNMNKSDDV